jgi:hypothetical protein
MVTGARLRGGASPELRRSRQSGVTAGLLACGLAVEYERGMGNPLVASGRGGIGRGEWLVGRGGSGSPAYRGSAVPAPGVIHWPRYQVQKGVQVEMGLT